ncbi:MAG: hypothetical protein JXD22_10240 [Sedimentisphaerales bacterium]|nr:hypothetical protein [Sedimentisphaerales bacterium]
MSPRPEKTKKAIQLAGPDIYTALLGLASFALMGAIAVVCIYGHKFFGEIFKITGP